MLILFMWHWSWGTSCFHVGNSVSQQTELLDMRWWQRSVYVIAWKNAMAPLPTSCYSGQGEELGAGLPLVSAWIVPPLSRTSLKQVASSPGTFSMGRPVTSNNISWHLLSVDIPCALSSKVLSLGMPVKQCFWINCPLKIRQKSQYRW